MFFTFSISGAPGESNTKATLMGIIQSLTNHKLDYHNKKVSLHLLLLLASITFLLSVFPQQQKDGRKLGGSASETPFHIQLPLFAEHHTAFLQCALTQPKRRHKDSFNLFLWKFFAMNKTSPLTSKDTQKFAISFPLTQQRDTVD